MEQVEHLPPLDFGPTERSGARETIAPRNAMGDNVTIQKNWQELIRPNKLQVSAGRRYAAFGDRDRRAARTRLRRDARQRAAPHSVVVAARRRGPVGAYRRRAARILLDRRRARGRDRHRAQHQGHRHQDAGRRPQAHGGEEAGPRHGHRQRHSDRRRRRRAQSRSRAVHARRGRRDPHGIHRQYRQGLRAGRAQPPGGRADRAYPGRQPLFAGAQGLLQGREHPRRPDPRLRQADADDRDQRRRDPRGRARLCRAHPAGSAQRVREFRGAASAKPRTRRSPISPSIRPSSRRSTSSNCRCARPTA